jgi:hypothetical protein
MCGRVRVSTTINRGDYEKLRELARSDERAISSLLRMLATLFEANLSGTDLRRTNLKGVKLFGANLQGAYIIEADLNGAMVEWSIFGGIDLSVVRGLDEVRHFRLSTIGIDTISLSKGSIPEVFLRGAGVPDSFIRYMASLIAKPIEYYTCLVCYSDEDRHFNDRFYVDLRTNGVRAWYFRKDARWGETVWGEIDRSIKSYDKVVVICSENSLQSGPVLREIERALQREDQEGKNILFPIRIDNYIFDRWKHPRKADVVSKVVGDFRGWEQDTDKYKAAFEKLLEALEAEG